MGCLDNPCVEGTALKSHMITFTVPTKSQAPLPPLVPDSPDLSGSPGPWKNPPIYCARVDRGTSVPQESVGVLNQFSRKKSRF